MTAGGRWPVDITHGLRPRCLAAPIERLSGIWCAKYRRLAEENGDWLRLHGICYVVAGPIMLDGRVWSSWTAWARSAAPWR